jgi:hypothetical protein
MKLSLAFSIGIVIGCAPCAFSVPLSTGSCKVLGRATSGVFRALFVSPANDHLPRPLTREDVVGSLSSIEEGDGYSDTKPQGAAAPVGLIGDHVLSFGLSLLPRRLSAPSPSRRPSFQLLC